jgi:hypothetical protein
VISNIANKSSIIMAGDFNGRIGKETYHKVVRQYGGYTPINGNREC